MCKYEAVDSTQQGHGVRETESVCDSNKKEKANENRNDLGIPIIENLQCIALQSKDIVLGSSNLNHNVQNEWGAQGPLIPEEDKPYVSSFQTTFVNDVSVDTTTSDFDLSQSDYLPEYE
ncbi:uncharacterized protein EAE98_009808 [Botrytis deweyae]|uniref:Uncharacterized protein n=1 Tax=Botrytis deweyae TaxID=2478750 RepID=A0ABQ7IAD1_9HELO|nr:uncharacterized protein EAE98_009808 [Botrytis deweyae]KAF7918196.1 hypothetical protein EAE98_009808 [Botrytis deweyae]